jgi:hypothetical protein
MSIFMCFVARLNSRDKVRAWVLALLVIACSARGAPAQELPDQIQNAYLQRLRLTLIGNHRVADLNMPVDLERRVADRMSCEEFERRYRIVVRDEPDVATLASTPVAGGGPSGAGLSLSPRWYLLLGGGVILVSLGVAMLSRSRKARA